MRLGPARVTRAVRYTPSPLRSTASPLVFAVLAASVVHVRNADAKAMTRGYTLEWHTSETCPSGDDVRVAIDALLVDADPGDGPTIAARGRVEPTASGHRLVLEIGGGGSPREIEGPDCVELSRTAALIVAIAVDPRVLAKVDRAVPPAPVEAPPDPPTLPVDALAEPPTASSVRDTASPATAITADDPTGVAPRDDTPPPSRSIGVAGAVAAGLDVGTLPAPSAHVALSFSVFTPRVRVDAVADYVPRRGIDSPSVPAIGIDVQAWSLGARGCWLWHVRRASLAACASARAGLVHARGRGPGLAPESARQPWVGVGPAGVVIVPLSTRVGLLAGLDVLVAASRGGFRTEPSGRVAQTWPVTPSAWLGIQWHRLTGPRGGGQPRR